MKALFKLVIFLILISILTAPSFAVKDYVVGKKGTMDRSSNNFKKTIEFRNPAVAALENGDFAIIFAATEGISGSSIYAQKFNINFKALGEAKRVADNSLPKLNIKAKTNPVTGDILIIWSEGSTDQRIKAALLNPELETRKSIEKIAVTTYKQIEPSLAFNEYGEAAIAWTEWNKKISETDNYDVLFRAFDKEMKSLMENAAIIATGDQKQYRPAIAFSSYDNVSVVYSVSSTPISYGDDIMMGNFNIYKDYKARNFEIKRCLHDQFNPKILNLGENRFFVVWENMEGLNKTIDGRVVLYNGTVLKEMRISDIEYDAKMPAVASLRDNFVVAWIESKEKDVVKAQIFDKSTIERVGGHIILDYSDTSKSNLALGSDDINFVAAYEEYNKINKNVSFVLVNKKPEEISTKSKVSSVNKTGNETAEDVQGSEPVEEKEVKNESFASSIIRNFIGYMVKLYAPFLK